MLLQDQRVPIVLHNLRAARRWRPTDVVNWHHLVWPLRQLPSLDTDFNMFQMLFGVFTRMAITYEPHPRPPPASAPAPDEDIREIAAAYARGEPRVGLFVDALDHLSGVSATLSAWVREARRRGQTMRLHTASRHRRPEGVLCFPPLGTLRLAAYQGMALPVPHVRQVLEYIRRSAFDVIHVSTPGPLGLLGLLAGRLLGVPVIGTYHTDFPRYARTLTGDTELELAARSFMHWFYGQMDAVAAPSPSTARELAQGGLESPALHVVGRGVDPGLFQPARRDAALRAQWGAPRKHHLLYAGRISREKNLACLASAFRNLCATRRDVKLIVVGDGPYREAMAAELCNCDVVFPGVLHGRALAAAYASCDLFVFPSETDTLGVVLLEAQASGLPVIVSAHGGPKDCMADGVTGRVVQPMNPANLASAISDLLRDPRSLARMGEAAREHAQRHTPAASFDAFWNFCCSTHPASGVVPAAESTA